MVDSGHVEDDEEFFAAFDVPEESVAETFVFAGAFNESGDVGQHDGAVFVFVIDDADGGVEGGEGVGGNSGAGVGKVSGEAGFAGIGKADEADVGDGFKDEFKVSIFSGFAGCALAGNAVDGGFEVDVAEAAPAAIQEGEGFFVVQDFFDRFAGFDVDDDGAEGDFQGEACPIFSVFVTPHSSFTVFGFPLWFEVVVAEVSGVAVSEEDDVASFAAIASIGSAFGDIFFPAEADDSVASVTGF